MDKSKSGMAAQKFFLLFVIDHSVIWCTAVQDAE